MKEKRTESKIFPLLMMAAASAALILIYRIAGGGLPFGEEGQYLYEKKAVYFDTVIQISFYADRGADALMDGCMEICEEAENTFSRTRETSELYRINHRNGSEVDVSQEMADVISLGLEYYEKTGGKFDITVAPLSDLWDFKSEEAAVPLQEEIAAAAQCVDASKVHLDGNRLTFDRRETMLDLGALAKGYTADRLKAYLTAAGVEKGLINLGGNILTIGSRPDGTPWQIGIQKPFGERGEKLLTVSAEDSSVVSSGIYERCFVWEDVIYHHILDPDTGYPIRNDLWGVTILSSSSLLGDALSTSCLALGREAAEEMISEMDGVEAIFVTDTLEIVRTDREGERE